MSETFLDGRVTLHGGDCRDVLRDMPDASIDSVVTDPPYALVSIVKRFGGANAAPVNNAGTKAGNTGDPYARAARGFMGKQWDTGETAFASEFWAEVLRVLKPGGHIVAAGGTRTYHHLAMAIEQAGFEIRDQLAWAYGSGFPKSHDVSKSIDRAAGAEREKIKKNGAPAYQRSIGNTRPWMDDPDHMIDCDEPATEDARQWQGWGTALKPAWEPICLARKPLIGTVAANVLEHGTGAINVDGCRVESDENLNGGAYAASGGRKPMEGDEREGAALGMFQAGKTVGRGYKQPKGRWPANLVHDGSEEVLAGFPDQTSGGTPANRNADKFRTTYGEFKGAIVERGIGSSEGTAARFFYTAKADAEDRLGSKHPTVKPVDLMQWLCRLITPPGGTVLDPFAGTGTTGEAAWREGFNAVLIEREEEYQADIRRRMAFANAGPEKRKSATVEQESIDGLPMFASIGAKA